ncbi:Uma2 family endonuclease [Persicitalea sp.]|uniref:Uma2 family endonuclease n=1 Tax=Persicitalea sp. TaxID=3100273 RepID=UPI0035948ACF
MAEIVETVEEREISQYELERGKPMPRLIHGAIQFNVGFELKIKYPDRFRIASEVTLDTKPDGSTPDLVLYPAMPLDFKDDPARRSDPPLLVVEIQSPSQSSADMVVKLEPYFYFGVKSCWIIAPDFRAAFVYSDPFNYSFFHGSEVLNDASLDIEVNLAEVFK